MMRQPALLPMVCVAFLLAGHARAGEANAAVPATTGAIQVVADLTLIDGACRDEVVNFGIVFRFAAEKGVSEVAVMPGGPRHLEFEATLRARRASFDEDELCGEIAENYAEALPGSVTLPPNGKQGQ